MDSPAYFWNLDNHTPLEVLREYEEALQDRRDTKLWHWVKLIETKVPIAPKAYLSSSFSETIPKRIPNGFTAQLSQIVSRFERITHMRLGGDTEPLLLNIEGDYCGSVRNIGATPATLRSLVHHYGKASAFALYIDFLESFCTLVLTCPHIDFRKAFQIKGDREGTQSALESMGEEQFLKYVRQYQNLVSQKTQKRFPETPERQLLSSLIQFAWMSKGAGGDEIFLSVQSHASSYGSSIKGVVYTRNPFTGDKDIYGVYQAGQDGKKHLLNSLAKEAPNETFKERYAEIYALIKMHLPAIEASFRDVIEAQFVADEDGHLYFTDFDKAQTTARATAVSAIELCRVGAISEREAALRIPPNDVEALLHPTLDENSRSKLEILGTSGITASAGTAIGYVFFKMSDAIEFHQRAKTKDGKRIILVADELLIADSPGISILSGMVMKAGGIASHAAVMARATGIPCIVGFKNLEFDSHLKSMLIDGKKVETGALLTVEAGGQGRVYLGEGKLHNLSFQEGLVKDISQLMTRVTRQERIALNVYVNINNHKDAEVGMSFGMDGVGLCRTENMFMGAQAIPHIRNIIFSKEPSDCKASFEALEEIQFADFKKIFQVLQGKSINIRLMDLPLAEFAPKTDEDFDALAKELKHLDKKHLRMAADGLEEHNPMLGLRACRFGLMVPELYNMQCQAILRAAYSVVEQGIEVDPGIMFPMVVAQEELERLRAQLLDTEQEVRETLRVPFGKKIKLRVGTMIEVPAAALEADSLARWGEFFAFGTNDLTQATLGMSRDDIARFLPFYLENDLLPSDPFKILCAPVKELLKIAITRGRRVRKDAQFGICGEQGGERTTLDFCLENAVNYVSCSPFRVLPTRVALVHAALEREKSAPEELFIPVPEPTKSPDSNKVVVIQNGKTAEIEL